MTEIHDRRSCPGSSSPARAAAETEPGLIVIRGARIVPVVGEEIPEGMILVRNGRIEAVGRNLAVPEGAEIVEAAGLIAYPGLIDSCTSLGMNEISNVAATVDASEIGRINPQLRIADALHMDSVHVPIARASGITAVHVVPAGSFIAGQSGIIRLSGRIAEDMIVKSPAFMHIYFQAGPQFINGSMAPGGKPDDLAKELKEILENARVYQKNKKAAEKNPAMTRPEFDEALEFLLPVINGRLPVMLDVGTEEEIKAAIKLVKEEKLKAVFFGAEEAWKTAEEIKEAGIPVILSNMYNFPSNWEDGYDAPLSPAGGAPEGRREIRPGLGQVPAAVQHRSSVPGVQGGRLRPGQGRSPEKRDDLSRRDPRRRRYHGQPGAGKSGQHRSRRRGYPRPEDADQEGLYRREIRRPVQPIYGASGKVREA